MDLSAIQDEAGKIAAAMIAEIDALPIRNAASMRRVRCKFSRLLINAPAGLIFALAHSLCREDNRRWLAYELVRGHRAAFNSLGLAELEELGRGINSWWTVDAFARTLSGPAWLARQIPDERILAWAGSSDAWWRRAALVSTVALNMRSRGGQGEASRTLRVCRVLAGDHDDRVVKALSWALRELVVHDPQAVREFLEEHESVLAARVKREARNKLRTGLKNP